MVYDQREQGRKWVRIKKRDEEDKGRYHMAGKFDRNKIWPIAPYRYVQKNGRILIWQPGRWRDITLGIGTASKIRQNLGGISFGSSLVQPPNLIIRRILRPYRMHQSE